MLQQTQVSTVIGYYQRFLDRFPNVAALAQAPLSDVLARWAGLGYYTRARMAHRCAQTVADQHNGQFPATAAALQTLPGIGPSTAAAIAAFCFNEQAAILDGNVKRVLTRYHGIEQAIDLKPTTERLWVLARQHLPAAEHMPLYTQAIMDLGATLCRRGKPLCLSCPVAENCQARSQGNATELPKRQARAARPTRQEHWLLCVHEGKILLEQRPENGLWGGLLALPAFETPEQLLAQIVAEPQPLASLAAQPLAQRSHGFTHFTLQFVPWLYTGQIPAQAWSSGWQWHALTDAVHQGIPAPVARLLKELLQAQEPVTTRNG